MGPFADILAHASTYWRSVCRTGTGADTMQQRATYCATLLEPWARSKPKGELLRSLTGAYLLGKLYEAGHSSATVHAYYSAFLRALTLSGHQVKDWPRPKPLVRKPRKFPSQADLNVAILMLTQAGFPETADLVLLLKATGMRVGIEALRIFITRDRTHGAFMVVGKGGHSREIPIEDPAALTLVLDAQRISELRAIPYFTHRWRLQRAVPKNLLASFHHIRHTYASQMLAASGGNLRLVQELLGHSSPTTTAIYADVSMADKAAAVRKAHSSL